jgi:uncharacterized protein YoxC
MTTIEKEKIRNFVKEYEEISFNINLMQKSIQSLAEKRDALLDRAETLKEDEQSFMATLIAKYGESEITPNKLLKALND